MTDADYEVYQTWNEDLTPETKEALKPNPNSTNLIDALQTLRALSANPKHWLTTQSRPWEDETTPTSELDGKPYYIPKRSAVVPSWLFVRFLYDADATKYKAYADSSKRIVVLSGVGFRYPFVKAPTFFQAGLPAKMFAYRVSETHLYDQYHEYMYRLPLEIFYLVYALIFLFNEMSTMNAAREQFYKHKFSGRKTESRAVCSRCSHGSFYRIWCEGGGICCSSGWDCFDVTTALMSICCILGTWIFAFTIPLYNTTHADIVRDCLDSGDCHAAGRLIHSMLLSALGVTGILNIVGVFKYTRYHEGMRVYTMLFHESWKTLRDFIPWFLLLMMTQAWFIAHMYSGAGTSSDMMHSGGALSTVIRLVFGFYDYDDFIGNNRGLGSATYMGAVVFWMVVGLGIVVAQNVMLAIVGQAYDNIQEKGNSLTTSMPLWTQSWNRLQFWCRRHSLSSPKTGKEWTEEDRNKYFRSLNKLPKWERKWFAVRFPGVNVLNYYFTDFGKDEEIVFPRTFWDPRKKKPSKPRDGRKSWPSKTQTEDPSRTQTKDDWKEEEDIFSEVWKYNREKIPDVYQPTEGDAEAEFITHKFGSHDNDSLMDYDTLLKFLKALHKTQSETCSKTGLPSHAMFQIRNCFFSCELPGKSCRWGPTEFDLQDGSQPSWNPIDLCAAIFWAFGETHKEIKENDEAKEDGHSDWGGGGGLFGSSKKNPVSAELSEVKNLLKTMMNQMKEMKSTIDQLKQQSVPLNADI